MGATSEAIYLIGCGPERQGAGAVGELGFKAYNLARMARLGVPVPAAFVLGTSWCRSFYERAGELPPGAREQLLAALHHLEAASGLSFASPRRPLLVSVRSGAPVSMPGMLETVLDVGLCDSTVSGLLRLTGNPRLVWDSYRRLIENYAEIVAGQERAAFAEATQGALAAAAATSLKELDFRALRALAYRELEIYRAAAGHPFPQSPIEQLEGAVAAVFRSWDAAKARFYRDAHGIDASLGTAVTVQRMVFGNAGGTSGAGVGFTRNPATGRAELYLDYAPNAQGEDVVSGRTELDEPALDRLPEHIAEELAELSILLERDFGDAQEFEFTVQNGELFVLQTRDAKRTPLAALRIAVELAEAGIITGTQARARAAELAPDRLDTFELAAAASTEPLATGIPASVGVATGAAVCDANRAIERSQAGDAVILVREDVSTSDIAALEVSAGLLACRGARTAHAAVVARQLGKVCIIGCKELSIDADKGAMRFGSRRIAEGELLTLDADTGRVYQGVLAVARRRPEELLAKLASLPA
ncbi:MAG TPA: PEP/pyruvate-binding domain-containing protein [Steroidobacteraceae bacterium]|nr:PEP/pyruvate-binding domain-containing protein [Steroidobacteraceae bacterium]